MTGQGCRPDTWEVVVYDGNEWFRGPVKFESRPAAEAAAALIRLAPVYVRSTRELDTVGLPEGAPDRC